MRVTPLPSDLLVPIFRDARDMLLLTWAGVRAPSGAALDTAAALGRGIHKVEKELTEQLVAGSDEGAPLRPRPAHPRGRGTRGPARHVELESMRFKDLVAEYARAHEDRLVDGVCRPASSSAYLGILDYLREITRHAQLIARRIAPRPAPGEGPFPRF